MFRFPSLVTLFVGLRLLTYFRERYVVHFQEHIAFQISLHLRPLVILQSQLPPLLFALSPNVLNIVLTCLL